ncbi:MAG: threo-3-hydroxy-L-aspartate ammonia-lyase [Bryobacteraceae bacterium]
MSITFEDIREAAARIAPIVHRTPVMTSRTFDAMTGATAFFKCENFQRAGAFKIRGASNAVFSLDEETRKRGVTAYSSGNHAQAVALAARIAGIPATIVMPTDAPKSKMEGTRGYGARVVTYDRMTEDRAAICARIAEETGASMIPPFDHPKVIAGQGTAALELLSEVPDLDALVVCISGGGLISGCATAAKALRPGIRVFGVEPEGADDTRQSLAAGKRIRIPPPTTIADGLRVECPGELTFPIMQKLLESVVTVSDDEIRATMKFFLLRMKMLVEPSGATAAAALMHGKLPAGLGRVGVVVSGGNVDWEMLMTL